jgi:hypothetical protein
MGEILRCAQDDGFNGSRSSKCLGPSGDGLFLGFAVLLKGVSGGGDYFFQGDALGGG